MIARGLVEADCTGHPSHGVVRVTRYLKWLSEGKLVANRHPEVIVETEGMALLDGGRGFGQVLAPAVVDLGVAKAKQHGLALVALKRSGHLGRIGDWAERAAEAGLVSLHFVNVRGHPLVAPFGSIERRMSTAPIAIGIPDGRDDPIILDFATSMVAEGKALIAAKSGRMLDSLPLIDADGCPSGDPMVLYGEITGNGPLLPSKGSGAIRAFGEHKGSGLALMAEIMAGVLTSSGNTKDEHTVGDVWSGMLSLFIDPGRLNADFTADLASYLTYFKATRSSGPQGGVQIPGDVERRYRAKVLRYGLELPRSVWRELESAATSLA